MSPIPKCRSEKKVRTIFVAAILCLVPLPTTSMKPESRRSNVGRSPKVPTAAQQTAEISDALYSKLVDRFDGTRLLYFHLSKSGKV